MSGTTKASTDNPLQQKDHKVEITDEGKDIMLLIDGADDWSDYTEETFTLLYEAERGHTFRVRHVVEAASALVQEVVIQETPYDLKVQLVKRVSQMLDWGWISIKETK